MIRNQELSSQEALNEYDFLVKDYEAEEVMPNGIEGH